MPAGFAAPACACVAIGDCPPGAAFAVLSGAGDFEQLLDNAINTRPADQKPI
jgi:hypothetical protein